METVSQSMKVCQLQATKTSRIHLASRTVLSPNESIQPLLPCDTSDCPKLCYPSHILGSCWSRLKFTDQIQKQMKSSRRNICLVSIRMVIIACIAHRMYTGLKTSDAPHACHQNTQLVCLEGKKQSLIIIVLAGQEVLELSRRWSH